MEFSRLPTSGSPLLWACLYAAVGLGVIEEQRLCDLLTLHSVYVFVCDLLFYIPLLAA